jgi:hypothetical protein
MLAELLDRRPEPHRDMGVGKDLDFYFPVTETFHETAPLRTRDSESVVGIQPVAQ